MKFRNSFCASDLSRLLRRPRNSHKGNYGKILILVGSLGMSGAARLSGMGALRSGAGLVTVGVPKAIYSVIARLDPELMVRPLADTKQGTLSHKALPEIKKLFNDKDAIGIGSGLSTQKHTAQLVRKVVAQFDKKIVLDADGLNAFVGHLDILKKHKSSLIITPHEGEFLRLFGGSLNSNNREKRAAEIAKIHNAIVVLKGHRTLVATPEGEIYINKTGNPGMATAGTGDVLTGMIAALWGQGFSGFDASRLGVFLHGCAGDIAAKKIGETSLVAGDVLNNIPSAFKEFLRKFKSK